MIELQIAGMSCQHCVAAVTRALAAVPGVVRADVDLQRGVARIEGEAAVATLVQAVADEGYSAAPMPAGS